MSEFRLPDIGEGLVEAEIVRWHVAVGDEVAVDQVVVEVETDKSIVEIPSPFAGVVERLGGEEGDVVEVGDVLLEVRTAGEDASVSAAESRAEPASEQRETPPPRDETSQGGPGVRATPAVRRMAAERGIDLARISGTGPGGAITAADVEAFAGTEPVEAGHESRRVPMSRTRRAIAEHMTRSWNEIPHVTTLHETPAGALLEARASLAADRDGPVPLEALVMKAVSAVLAAFPEFNASVDGSDLVVHDRHDIGFAVDTPDGLVVPVVRQVASSTLDGVVARVLELADLAKQRRVPPDDLAGATFTITNIGAVGGGHGTPIIPHGTVAILSLGRATEQPVVRDGTLGVDTIMPLSISYDHRVIDGAHGQRFMTALIATLTEPDRFLDAD